MSGRAGNTAGDARVALDEPARDLETRKLVTQLEYTMGQLLLDRLHKVLLRIVTPQAGLVTAIDIMNALGACDIQDGVFMPRDVPALIMVAWRSLTYEQRREIMNEMNASCFYCGQLGKCNCYD